MTRPGKIILIVTAVVSVTLETMMLCLLRSDVKYVGWAPVLFPFLAISFLTLIVIVDATVRACRDVFGPRIDGHFAKPS